MQYSNVSIHRWRGEYAARIVQALSSDDREDLRILAKYEHCAWQEMALRTFTRANYIRAIAYKGTVEGAFGVEEYPDMGFHCIWMLSTHALRRAKKGIYILAPKIVYLLGMRYAVLKNCATQSTIQRIQPFLYHCGFSMDSTHATEDGEYLYFFSYQSERRYLTL